MSYIRPAFGAAWNRFQEINVSVRDVGNIIGGKVQHNIDSGFFVNACPIRMSYVLNYCGVPIPGNGKYAVVSGKDKKQYMYRVNDMIEFLQTIFGAADSNVNAPVPGKFTGKQGIIIFSGSGWGNARGHVTLWNGNICSDDCHFVDSPANGPFIPDTAKLWTLA